MIQHHTTPHLHVSLAGALEDVLGAAVRLLGHSIKAGCAGAGEGGEGKGRGGEVLLEGKWRVGRFKEIMKGGALARLAVARLFKEEK